ncbi:LapA family protein [Yinghuangia soli]|uniref:LapA family protein n=1 Tax=Yinghuangia soli TaxID=2908204 RepID=A0AA41PVY1_9ACTN|nr:LapA family protein [Yinghuangia soli]MCF2526597.1 LapA family protein [Yinghuangia soli]
MVTVRGKDYRLRTLALALLGVLAVWFVVANTESVEIRLWIPTVSLPLWLVLAVTLLVGITIGLLIARRRTKA